VNNYRTDAKASEIERINERIRGLARERNELMNLPAEKQPKAEPARPRYRPLFASPLEVFWAVFCGTSFGGTMGIMTGAISSSHQLLFSAIGSFFACFIIFRFFPGLIEERQS